MTRFIAENKKFVISIYIFNELRNEFGKKEFA